MLKQTPPAFFSYSREDEDFALRLAKDLKASGAGRAKRKPQLTDLVQVWAGRVACTVASGAPALEQTL